MSEFQPPRRLRLSRHPQGVVSLEFIQSLLASQTSEELYGRVLERLVAELAGVEQAFLWVRDGQHRFRLAGVAGADLGSLRGLEALPEALLQSHYGGPGWAEGAPKAVAGEGHFLGSLLGNRMPSDWASLFPQMPSSALVVPLVFAGQVWMSLYLHAPGGEGFAPEAVELVGDFGQSVAPVLREWYLREIAERRSLWLSAINTLLRAPREQALEVTLQDAIEEVVRLSGAEGARLISLEGFAIRTVAQAGWVSGLGVEAAVTRQIGDRLRAGEQVSIPRYDLYPGRRPELVEAGVGSLYLLPIQRQSSETSALLLFSTAQQWLPDAQTQELLADMGAAIGVVRTEWALRRELAWAAYTDPLTGLGNRRAFERDLGKIIDKANGRLAVLVLLDLDGFKGINDTYGHVHADHVLVRLGGALRARARAGDQAYRLGGDEFALIIEGPSTLNPARTAERYRALLEEIRVSDGEFLRASLGYAVYPQDAADLTSLWRAADDQMYRDKALRKTQPSAQPPLFGEAEAGGARPAGAAQSALARLGTRLGHKLGLRPDEQEVLLAASQLLDAARRGVQAPALPEGLLKRVAGVMMFVQGHWDGGGSLPGVSGEAIPRPVRVLQVAQAFLVSLNPPEGSPRPGLDQALEGLEADSGTRFDPAVVAALRSIKDQLRAEDLAA